MRNELKQQVIETFTEDALIFKLGIVNRSVLLKKYQKFCAQASGKGLIWYRDIFNPLALEIWLQEFKEFIIVND